MMGKLTDFSDYFMKIHIAFLVAIGIVLFLILFLPEQYAKIVAVDGFRKQYRVYLGPAFLITTFYCLARFCVFLMQVYNKKKDLKRKQESLHKLTPEEKGYLRPFIENQQNSIYVGMDDGVMAGLQAKKITFLATRVGSFFDGSPFNLQPWAKDYLEKNKNILEGATGKPMTPYEKINFRKRW